MKVQWEASDIRAGRIVGKLDRTERWMIGYIGHGGDYALVSMFDGMICEKMSAQQMADTLNKSGEILLE
jgi:hypothetical protein